MAKASLEAWVESLGTFALPEWGELPELDLYMDQVVLLLSRYLAPMSQNAEERAITASTINNYVRLKILPPPVKKKYSRCHLACLIILCTLKPCLSIASIRRLLPPHIDEESVRTLYTAFVAQLRAALDHVRTLSPAAQPAALPQENDLPVAAAIAAVLAKSLTEYLLAAQPEDEAPQK